MQSLNVFLLSELLLVLCINEMVLFSACSINCLSCTMNGNDDGTVCKADQCAPKFALKAADKTCMG